MSTFSTNTVEMRNKGLAVQGTIERLRAEVNAMQSGLRELEATWQGAAAGSFQAVVADWRATQLRVEESLAAINTALARATQHYEDAEQANTAMFIY